MPRRSAGRGTVEDSPVHRRTIGIDLPRIATTDSDLPGLALATGYRHSSKGHTPPRSPARQSVDGASYQAVLRTQTWDSGIVSVSLSGSRGGDGHTAVGAAACAPGDDKGGGGGGSSAAKKKKLGTFKGVLVPTCENMWGVLIFLRFYTIVGNAGLGMSVLIVTLSFMVALLTSLSLSAIATCGTSHSIQGVYPMLSRALGKEIATAIGFVYFLGIVFLAVLECLGACEELFMVNRALGEFPGAVQMWGSIFMFSLVVLVGGGIKLVSQLGLLFFGIVVLTLLLFYVGLFGAPHLHAFDAEAVHPPDAAAGDPHGRALAGEYNWNLGLSGQNMVDNAGPDYAPGTSFATYLALFFPCFTGILSGANRASSLRDPANAIPYGTLGAISISYVMYMSYMLLWAAVGDRAFLKMDHGQLDLLLWPSVKLAQVGIVLSSLGQALQCLVVAPRLLASIAADRVLRVLTPLSVKTAGEPKRALLFAYVVGGLCVLLGSLDLVAPLLSMCFLLCYSFMNLNCFVLDILKDPHWRPKWKYFHWSVGLFGFLLCTALMFTINYIYALVAFALAGVILVYILHSNAETDWGSALHGLRFQLAVRSLLAIDMGAHLESNWKPQLLLLYQLTEENQDQELDGTGRQNEAAGHTHKVIFSLANQLRHGSGLTVACAVIPLLDDEGEDDPEAVRYAESEKQQMNYLMKEMGVEGFCMTVLTRSVADGKAFAIQSSGLGPLTPNTVLMGWPWWWKKDPRLHVPAFVSAVNQCTLRRKAVLLGHNLKDFPTDDEPPVQGYIDVWWIKHDGGLLLLLSHLLKKHHLWRRCLLRLHLITESGTNPELIKERVHRLLNIINISATVEEVILVDSTSLLPYMQSSDTRLRNQEAAAKDKNENLATVEQIIENPVPLPDEDEELRTVMMGGRRSISGRAPFPEGPNREPSSRVNVVDMRAGGAASDDGAVRRCSISAHSQARLDLDSYLKDRNIGSRAQSAVGSGSGRPAGDPPKVPLPRRFYSEPPPSPPLPPAGGILKAGPGGTAREAGLDSGAPAPGITPRPWAARSVPKHEPPPSPPRPAPIETPAGEPQMLLPPSLMDAPMRRSVEARQTELQRFIDRLGLDADKAAELSHIFERSVNEAKQGAVSYMWDEIHEIIQSRSEHSELVIINLPDPPEVQRVRDGYSDHDFTRMVEYMDYMEGLSRNLPRVLFVHGAGQEVIQFE